MKNTDPSLQKKKKRKTECNGESKNSKIELAGIQLPQEKKYYRKWN